MGLAVISESNSNGSVITVRLDNTGKDWEQWVLLRADAHHDNLYCDHALEKRHLEEAKERNALICDFGDLFCAMQGKWDKRADQNQLRPELHGNNYLDKLVEYNTEFYEPFADNFVMFGDGNHETKMLERHQTHLTERMVERLRMKRTNGQPLHHCGFSGWIRFLFMRSGDAGRTSLNLKWHHGYGGDAPVTKGVIQTNRMSVYLPDADFVVTGHTHNEWIFPITRERISNGGVLFKDRQMHIKVPGYKDEYAEGVGGWHIERGGPPKPLGAAWLRFFYNRYSPGRVDSEVTMAR